MGFFLIVLGSLFVVLGGISILIKAFKESLGWGLGCFFIPLLQLVFVYLFWNETKGVFYLQLVGVGSVLLGAFLL